MAPLHHHYELKGWPEPRIIVRFWIITVVLVLMGLASLKITVMFNVKQQSTPLPEVNYLVVGLGLTGYSSARFLLRHGYRCRLQDTRDLPPYLATDYVTSSVRSNFEARATAQRNDGMGRRGGSESRHFSASGCTATCRR